MVDLHSRHCVPCEGGAVSLGIEEINKYLHDLRGRWEKVAVFPEGQIKKIRTQILFSDFKAAITFINRIAEIAESEGHHPDIHVMYNKVVIELWTHAVGGLSENDFIMASRIDEELGQRSNTLLSQQHNK